MDRISLTWEAALADPSVAVALLRRLEEQAETYIARSRTLREWLENVPPFSAMGDFLHTTAPGDGQKSGNPADGNMSDRTSSPADGDGGPEDGPAPAGPQDCGPGDAPGQPTPPAGEHAAGPEEAMGEDKGETSAGFVPPPRRPAGSQDATAKHREGGRGRKEAAPPGGEGPTLRERVEAVLETFRPGAPLTVRGVALEIGHANLRSLRPVLDRMAEQGQLVKTELHPRAVVYHRPEPAGSAKEATMF
ncbi:hypothetical protein [Streptomyces sp. CA-146814]|uniref:hypothetical protein n=1 Tax=Streptomyces sp. CA-146814 TaxID=3240053 RepID=UPI003D9133FB